MSITGPNPSAWQKLWLVAYGFLCFALALICFIAYALGPLAVIGILVSIF